MTCRLNVGMRQVLLWQIIVAFQFYATNYVQLSIYSGSQPTSADDAPTGTFLGTIQLALDSPYSGTGIWPLPMSTSVGIENMGSGSAVASGTAGWGRLSDDGNTISLDGTVGAPGSGEDFEIASTTVANGQPLSLIVCTIST